MAWPGFLTTGASWGAEFAVTVLGNSFGSISWLKSRMVSMISALLFSKSVKMWKGGIIGLGAALTTSAATTGLLLVLLLTVPSTVAV
jgi:hypothetical protein